MIVYKEPKFENDSFMMVIEENDLFALVGMDDVPYFAAKDLMFDNKYVQKHFLKKFADRPSLRDFESIDDLRGTVYTHTCEGKNRLDYKHIIKYCKRYYKQSRRCAINFADTLSDYLLTNKNTSCLNSIHYCGDNVTLYFRASDIKNELLIDLHLIHSYFIKPVGNFKTITVFASTAQNIETKLSTLIQ